MPGQTSEKVKEYQFGQCRIDLATREIFLDGKHTSVEPKAFELLVYLIENRDRAVDKDELQDSIWPGVIVTEGALSRCVMKARRATGDNDAITTVRGHGYRFVAPLEEVTSSTQASTKSNRPSLVVLPFVNIGGAESEEYFSDGITDDVITELSRFRSLMVIARPSAFRYKGQSLGAMQIRRELGVDYIVDGSVQRSGDRLRMNVRLVDAHTDSQMWSDRYDREVGDVLRVQEELAATIAATVGGRVEVTRGRAFLDNDGLASYDCLLRAQALYYEFDKGANSEARELLERAIELDPNNARALAILAAVHSMDSWTYWVEDTDESQRLSVVYGRRSIELDDSDSLAHALYAEILHDVGEETNADRHFERAIALNPSDIAARALYASKLAARGIVEPALTHLRVAEQLDPFGLGWIPLIRGSVMYAAGEFDESIAAIQSMTAPPDEALLVLVAALAQQGRLDEAAAVKDRLLASAAAQMPNYPGDTLDAWHPIIARMRGPTDDETIESFKECLRLAGWQ